MIDDRDNLPAYLRIAQLLRQEITSGRYKIGDLIPSETDLCATYSVANHTVRRAVAVIRSEGLIVTKRGAGSTIRYIPPRITVHVKPGDQVSARLPTPAERGRLELPEGVWIIAVTRPGAEQADLFDASRADLILGDS